MWENVDTQVNSVYDTIRGMGNDCQPTGSGSSVRHTQ